MPYITPDTIPSDTSCVVLRIPNDRRMIAAVFGALLELTYAYNWEQIDGVTPDEAAAAADTMYWDAFSEDCVVPAYPTIDVFCCNSELLSGAGTLTYLNVATLPFAFVVHNNNTANYGIENFVWLPAGDYDYDGWASLTTDGGNTTVAIVDGTGVIDTIIPSVSQNGAFGSRIHHTGTFTIPASGLYRIVVANDGTGSGSNRRMNWTSHHIRQVP